MDEHEKAKTSLIQITMDNGPERSGRRTPFLSRMVQFGHWFSWMGTVLPFEITTYAI